MMVTKVRKDREVRSCVRFVCGRQCSNGTQICAVRLTQRFIQALMRFSVCAAVYALLKGHGESNSLVSREQGSAFNTFPDGLRFCEERHANASYFLADNYRS